MTRLDFLKLWPAAIITAILAMLPKREEEPVAVVEEEMIEAYDLDMHELNQTIMSYIPSTSNTYYMWNDTNTSSSNSYGTYTVTVNPLVVSGSL